MARPLQETKLDTRAARAKLKVSGKPYWREIDPGLHLGYRKGSTKGVWCVRWSIGAGDHKSETFATADDFRDADGDKTLSYVQAMPRAREVYQQAIAPKPEKSPAPPPKVYTVADALADYIIWADEHTKSGEDDRVSADVVPELGAIPVMDLTPRRIIEWRDALAKRGKRLRTRPGDVQKFAPPPKTADAIRQRKSSTNRVLTILKAALNHAARRPDETGVTSDAGWKLVEPFENVDSSRLQYLTVEECIRLINACPPDFRRLIRGALLTGARYAELTLAEVRDYDPAAGTLLIPEERSKGGKRRYIHLTDEGIETFGSWCTGKDRGDRIFLREDGGHWGKNHQVRPIAEACAVARISPAITFHILRHTWASLSIMNGMELIVVAENLGHADTRMVEKHYGHLASSFKARRVRESAPRFGSIEGDEKVVPLKRGA